MFRQVLLETVGSGVDLSRRDQLLNDLPNSRPVDPELAGNFFVRKFPIPVLFYEGRSLFRDLLSLARRIPWAAADLPRLAKRTEFVADGAASHACTARNLLDQHPLFIQSYEFAFRHRNHRPRHWYRKVKMGFHTNRCSYPSG